MQGGSKEDDKRRLLRSVSALWDALGPLFRVSLCLDGCADLLCLGIQPTAVCFLFVPAFVRT